MSDGDAPILADEDAPTPDAQDGDFRRLLEKLATEHNFDFREYKDASLARRVRARMSQLRLATFAEYIAYLDRHTDEKTILFNTLLINITAFFRDPEAWQAVRDDIVPRLVNEASQAKAIRVWSAGCSSGEEAYSVAILLSDHLGESTRDYDIKIYGTDIDEEALASARQGLYRTEQLKDVPPELLTKYFQREGQMYRFRRDLRRWCIFGRHNLGQDPPLSYIDFIVCRNVLIYFKSDLQERILPNFHYALRAGGYLFLGKSESLLARSRRFIPLHLKWRIFQRSTTAILEPVPLHRTGSREAARSGNPGRPDARDMASRLQQVIDALQSAVMVIDTTDTIVTWNSAAEALYDIPGEGAVGRKFRDLDISYRVEALRARIEDVKARRTPMRMDDVTFTRRSGQPVHADITIAPLLDDRSLAGVLVSAVDTTDSSRLRDEMSRVGEQHATAIEELQSTNEELETTNEELQSTNEELETTNEELQSTNEELETTVDELQAANAELATLNARLEARDVEMRRLATAHQNLLDSLESAVVAVDGSFTVTTWNAAAAHLWGLRAEHAVGREFFALPIGDATKILREPVRKAVRDGRAQGVSEVPVQLAGRDEDSKALVRVLPLAGEQAERTGVLLVASLRS